MVWVGCEICGEGFSVTPSRAKRGVRFCSIACRNVEYSKVRRRIRKDGYVQLTGGGLNVLEHRYLVEQSIGRKLDTREQVHHRNEIKSDNRLRNFKVFDIEDHTRLHHPGRNAAKRCVVECEECGKEVDVLKNKIEQHPKTFCNRECYTRHHSRNTKHSCEHCGKIFVAPPSHNRRFCSPKCSIVTQGAKRKRKECKCAWCGAYFEVAERRNPKYCGRLCMAEAFRK